MVVREPLRSVLAAALTLLAAGCYTAECEKMGYAKGTPEHARCTYQLQSQLTQQLNLMTQQLNGMSQQLATSRQSQPTGLTGISGEGLADSPAESPPLGLYKCYSYAVQPGWGGVSVNYAFEFTLLEGEKYRFYDNIGTYSYDPATRSLDFGDGDSAKYMGLNSSGYTLKVRLKSEGSNFVTELACHRRP
jgi:hypothetical protein